MSFCFVNKQATNKYFFKKRNDILESIIGTENWRNLNLGLKEQICECKESNSEVK